MRKKHVCWVGLSVAKDGIYKSFGAKADKRDSYSFSFCPECGKRLKKIK